VVSVCHSGGLHSRTFPDVALLGLLSDGGMNKTFHAHVRFALILALFLTAAGCAPGETDDRVEVVFWHFWGGNDRDVVDDVVRRFNASQERYRVRGIAMPGNNLQAKLFLSITGGDPPDLVNQDEPILADWARAGVIQSIGSVASEEDLKRLRGHLLDSARRLSEVDGELYAICNGLDIRALYYNKTLLEQNGLAPPRTIVELDRLAEALSPSGRDRDRDFYAFLPDSRRIWAWGFVFGGDFYDRLNRRAHVHESRVVDALSWMVRYSIKYGPENIAAFRQTDQTLPDKSFPLLPSNDHDMVGRYGLLMDGQWRTRDVAAFVDRRGKLGLTSPEFGVCPLPFPEKHGRPNAGWINGNFFVIPRGAKNAPGALEFAKFWVGLDDPGEAAKTCALGGWIPVSQDVITHPTFQKFVDADPLFAPFVELAFSPNQFPIPAIPGALNFKRSLEEVAYQAMDDPHQPVAEALVRANDIIQRSLDRAARRTSCETKLNDGDEIP
jgi:multiple sugar transport system substrate-binding protein